MIQLSRPLEPSRPNESGATICEVRWVVETSRGWVGAWDRDAIEQLQLDYRMQVLVDIARLLEERGWPSAGRQDMLELSRELATEAYRHAARIRR